MNWPCDQALGRLPPAAAARPASRPAWRRPCARPQPPASACFAGACWRWTSWSVIWLTAVLMKVPGPKTTFAGLSLASSRQRRRQPLQPPCRHVARQAALELDQPPQVRAQHRALEVALALGALDQHDHGVVAEVLLEALAGLGAVRGARHQRVHAGLRLEPQRERGAGQRQHPHHGQHQAGRRVTARASEPKKSSLTSRSLGSRDRAQLREPARLVDQPAEVALLAAGRRRHRHGA